MTLEIKKPELEALIEELRKSGTNLDEVLFNKLNAPASTPQKSEGKSASNPRPNLADFLLNSPLRGAELKIDRQKDGPRPVEL